MTWFHLPPCTAAAREKNHEIRFTGTFLHRLPLYKRLQLKHRTHRAANKVKSDQRGKQNETLTSSEWAELVVAFKTSGRNMFKGSGQWNDQYNDAGLAVIKVTGNFQIKMFKDGAAQRLTNWAMSPHIGQSGDGFGVNFVKGALSFFCINLYNSNAYLTVNDGAKLHLAQR